MSKRVDVGHFGLSKIHELDMLEATGFWGGHACASQRATYSQYRKRKQSGKKK